MQNTDNDRKFFPGTRSKNLATLIVHYWLHVIRESVNAGRHSGVNLSHMILFRLDVITVH